jgi:antirestriction protein ArdC
MKTRKKTRRDVYQEVTDNISSQMEKGVVPWRKPWSTGGGSPLPMNLASGKRYRGINIWLLNGAGFDSPWWLTYRQAAGMGGHVKKGEKGTQIVFWQFIRVTKTIEEGDKAGETYQDTVPMARAYTVFNLGQCEGVKAPDAEVTEKVEVSTDAAVALLSDYISPPQFSDAYNYAAYNPSQDLVKMPPADSFEGAEEYASTLFHEYIHSTGHKGRLGRIASTHYGDDEYSEEEVTAEMGAACLCAVGGVAPKTLGNSAAYIQHWLGVLREDKRFLFRVSSAAQKAVDWCLGISNQ